MKTINKLFCAIINGDITRVKILIHSQENRERPLPEMKSNPVLLTCRDDIGRTPLILACKHGNKEIAEYLIIKGADVNAKDINNETALQKADTFALRCQIGKGGCYKSTSGSWC